MAQIVDVDDYVHVHVHVHVHDHDHGRRDSRGGARGVSLARLLLLVSVALAALGCPVGLGDRCAADAECRNDLVCRTAPDAGAGACDYALRAEGGLCTTADVCESALTCSNHFTPGERYGSCVPRRGSGEPCFVKRDCLSGRCSGATSAAADGVCE